jgi:hypothetical protein
MHAFHGQPARQLGSLRSRLATNIAGTGLLDKPLKQILLDRLADMPDGDRLCHGDFHPVNVLGQNSLPMVIDWPDACCGGPAADVCRSYLLLKLHAEDIAEPYLDAYCNITNMPRAKILDWLPYVAAAKLAEDVPDDWARLLEIVHAQYRDLGSKGGRDGPGSGQGRDRDRGCVGNRRGMRGDSRA